MCIRKFNNQFISIMLALALGGCSAMTPGKMEDVQPVSSAARAGNVYLLRGWIGIFSTGIDRLGEKVNAAGVRGLVYQESQWRELAQTIIGKYRSVRDPEPIILVGHSYGADDVVLIARELHEAKIPVELVVTLDPTTPPKVPANVRHCVNLYQSSALDGLPWLRGIPLVAENDFKGRLENINIRIHRTDLLDDDVNHFNIEKKDKIHAETLKRILAVCPTREQWVMSRQSMPLTVGDGFNAPPASPARSRMGATASTDTARAWER